MLWGLPVSKNVQTFSADGVRESFKGTTHHEFTLVFLVKIGLLSVYFINFTSLLLFSLTEKILVSVT